MSNVRFIGLTRERVYSPGRVADDSAILHQVAAVLRDSNREVMVVDGDAADWPQPDPSDVVFAMAQGPTALERMAGWSTRGVRVINHPDAILHCQRSYTVPLLRQADVGFPPTMMVEIERPSALPAALLSAGVWVKRGDVHATDPGDVVFAADAAAIDAALAAFRARGIARVAVQRHVAGEVIKFYGVRDGFFHCVEPVAGESPARSVGEGLHPDTRARLAEIAQRAARALGVEVFGGDCVVSRDGGLHIIDLNDWPSYRACRSAAATAIAAYLLIQSQGTS
jgi:hypothetical protein